MLRVLDDDQKDVRIVDTPGGKQEMSIVSEIGIYAIIMRSRRKEAAVFQKWVYSVIRTLRQASGLEGFQIFRMLDKEHQKEAMAKLKAGLRQPVRVDFMKANTIANKAVSTRYGHKKMIGKTQMTPEMLVDREPLLDDTVKLKAMVDCSGRRTNSVRQFTRNTRKESHGMSYLNQVVDAIRSILLLIPEEQRQEAVRQLNRELGLQQLDVPRMYRDHDIAERYSVHVRTVREWIVSGRLRGVKIDRYWYSRADWLGEVEHKEMNKGNVKNGDKIPKRNG